jgi:hypothetical protein
MAQKWNSRASFDLLLVIHLPRVAGGCYSGYPGSPWQSVHIDELRSLQQEMPMRMDLLKNRSIYEILKSEVDDEIGVVSFDKLTESVIPKAASMIKGENLARQITRIDKFLEGFRARRPIFKKITLMKLVEMLAKKEQKSSNTKDWLTKMSLYNESLREGNTFREAVWSHLQDYIAGPLAQLMAFIDTNDNLDFLRCRVEWKVDFFMHIYRQVEVPFISDSNHEAWIKTHGPKRDSFKLPFSWILVNLVSNCMQQAGGAITPDLLLSNKEGTVLIKTFEAEEKAIVPDYIEDFIKLSVDLQNENELSFLKNRLLISVQKAQAEEDLLLGMEVLIENGNTRL